MAVDGCACTPKLFTPLDGVSVDEPKGPPMPVHQRHCKGYNDDPTGRMLHNSDTPKQGLCGAIINDWLYEKGLKPDRMFMMRMQL
jgi:hypothetical protein